VLDGVPIGDAGSIVEHGRVCVGIMGVVHLQYLEGSDVHFVSLLAVLFYVHFVSLTTVRFLFVSLKAVRF